MCYTALEKGKPEKEDTGSETSLSLTKLQPHGFTGKLQASIEYGTPLEKLSPINLQAKTW